METDDSLWRPLKGTVEQKRNVNSILWMLNAKLEYFLNFLLKSILMFYSCPINDLG